MCVHQCVYVCACACICPHVCACSSLKKFFLVFILERQRETECKQEGEAKRGTQDPKQAPGFELSAQSPMQGSNS